MTRKTEKIALVATWKVKKNYNNQNAVHHSRPLNPPAGRWCTASWAELGCGSSGFMQAQNGGLVVNFGINVTSTQYTEICFSQHEARNGQCSKKIWVHISSTLPSEFDVSLWAATLIIWLRGDTVCKSSPDERGVQATLREVVHVHILPTL